MIADRASPSYVYVKNGDAVAQVSQLSDADLPRTTSGPNAFIFDFLERNRDSEILVVSRFSREASFRSGKITARVLRDGDGMTSKLVRRTLNFFRLFRLLVSTRPERIICGSTGSQLLAVTLYCVITGVPFIHSRHNRLEEGGGSLLHHLRGWTERVCMRRASAVICHGPYLAEQLKNLGISPHKIIDFDVGFQDLLGPSGSTNGSVSSIGGDLHASQCIVFLGRLVEDKGVNELLAACVPLLHDDAGTKLIYAGEGPCAADLENVIRSNGLQGHAVLLGRLSRSEIVGLLRCAHVVVTPTRSGFPEGRCMSAMEAMVFGVPVIAPDFGPFPFIVKHGVNGFLYEPDSVEELRRSIGMILENEHLRGELAEGAQEFGRTILETNRSFGEAVEQAFNSGKFGMPRAGVHNP